MNKTNLTILFIIVLSFAIGAYFYPQMPDLIASHWNAQGMVDGYMSKLWGLFLMPILSVIMFLLFVFLPKIDPYKKNIDKFMKYYNGFILAIILFLFFIYLLSLAWNLGYRFNMVQFMAPAMGILFYCAGILIGKAERNWFIGIRTPWTLSSEEVWKKTHKLGEKLFKISGIIAFLGVFFQQWAIFLVIVPALFNAFYTILYSYFEYQKENKRID